MVRKINYQIRSMSKVNLGISCYLPNQKPKAIIHVLHGMQEHRGRYESLAKYLAEYGYLVLAHDHLGHGESICKLHPMGDMVNMETILRDVHLVRRSVIQLDTGFQDLEKLKYIIFGHSMGSFIARAYASKAKVDALIACGSGIPSYLQTMLMKPLLYLSPQQKPLYFIQKMIDATLSKGFHPKWHWLTYNEENYQRFSQDPLCGQAFTKEGYLTLAQLSLAMSQKKTYENCSAKEILLIAGEDDPVGQFTKGVRESARRYLKVGKSVQSIFYPNMSHEILNEKEKLQVYEDVIDFLSRVVD